LPVNERDIFLAALDIADPTARREFLDRACPVNTALRASVETLLAAHEGASRFLQTPLVQPSDSVPKDSHFFQ
jgi:hypothetical protein